MPLMLFIVLLKQDKQTTTHFLSISQESWVRVAGTDVCISILAPHERLGMLTHRIGFDALRFVRRVNAGLGRHLAPDDCLGSQRDGIDISVYAPSVTFTMAMENREEVYS